MNSLQILFFKILATIITLSILSSCQDDIPLQEPPQPIDYSYKIDISSPELNQTYNIGDTISIEVDFISETDEYVHNIQLAIVSADSSKEIYDVQSHVHVPESYAYSDKIILTNSLIQEQGSEWLCIGSMWDHSANPETISDTIRFQILKQ